jgi:hypothetical protein
VTGLTGASGVTGSTGGTGATGVTQTITIRVGVTQRLGPTGAATGFNFKTRAPAEVSCDPGETAIGGGAQNIFNGTDAKNGIVIAESVPNAARTGWRVVAVQTSKNESNSNRTGFLRAWVICTPTAPTVETEQVTTVTATQTT